MDIGINTSSQVGGMNFYGLKIGGTPLHDVPQLSGRYGCRVLVKDESANEASGTFKDRRNVALLLEDQNVPGKRWYIHITTGNQGFSLGRICSVYNKEEGYASGNKRYVLNIVDRRLPESIKRALSGFGKVHEVDLRKSKIPNNVLEDIGRDFIGDRNATYRSVEKLGDFGDGYGSLAAELFPEQADYWFCPVGEGELMTKLALEIHGRDNAPRIIGSTIDDNVFAAGKDFHAYAGKSPADKLVTAYSDFREMLNYMCEQDGHSIEIISDREIMEESEYLKGLQIRAEPSAAAAFAGARKYAARNLGVLDKVIIINTGYGLYEPVSMRSQTVMRVAATALAASLLLPISEHTDWQRRSREKAAVENSKREMLQYDVVDEVKAFAEFMSNGTPDPKIVSALSMYHTTADNWMRTYASPRLQELEQEFETFRSLRHSIKGISYGDPEERKYSIGFLREAVSEALRTRSGIQPHENGQWPFVNAVTMNYLDQDPEIGSKMRFALQITGGKKNEEFVKTVADLHWPYYWTPNNGLCGENNECLKTREDYVEWRAEEYRKGR